MRKKMILRAMVAMVLAIALLSGSAMAASRSARVFAPSMVIYRSVGKGIIGALDRGTSVTVKGVKNGWAKLSYRGRTCYARVKNIEFTQHIKAVTKKSSSIRFITRSSYKKGTYYTATLSKGVTVYLAGISGGNYLFYNADGDAVGYVSKSAVRRAK